MDPNVTGTILFAIDYKRLQPHTLSDNPLLHTLAQLSLCPFSFGYLFSLYTVSLSLSVSILILFCFCFSPSSSLPSSPFFCSPVISKLLRKEAGL